MEVSHRGCAGHSAPQLLEGFGPPVGSFQALCSQVLQVVPGNPWDEVASSSEGPPQIGLLQGRGRRGEDVVFGVAAEQPCGGISSF